jgi:excisionase family DNA binding protein
MLTATDVARQLGVSRRHVYALAERGELQAYRFGDAVRFAPEDLAAYIERCRSTSTKPAAAGATNSTAALMDHDAALRSYFRRLGVAPKPKPTRASETPSSTPLSLVPSSRRP